VIVARRAVYGASELSIAVLSRVGLEQHAIDLFEVDGPGAVPDCLDEGCDAEVSGAPEDAFGGPYDEPKRYGREGRVRHRDAIELGPDEVMK
jgi:hypothetical protein